jgi:parvulin-like peptidyl-prolyl isomerase
MLDSFRRNSRSAVIYVLFAILIAVFILTFNTSSRMSTGGGGDASQVLATVAGHDIDTGDFNLALNVSAPPPRAGTQSFERIQDTQRYETTRLLFSGAGESARLTDFDGPVPPLMTEKVMTELTATLLVGDEARKQGLAVSDAELAHRLLTMQRQFGESLVDENGAFDAKKYDAFVRGRLGTSKASLEAFLRREILRDKLAAIVTAGVTLTPAELDALVTADSKRPRLEYVTIDTETAGKTIQVSDADADAFAAAHADKIQAAYDAKGETYKVADKWDVRGILVEAPSPNSPALANDAAKKAEVEKQREEKHTAAVALRADLDKAWNGEVDLPVVATTPDAQAEGAAKKATELQGQEKTDRLIGYFGKIAGEKTDHQITKDVGGKFINETAEALARTPFSEQVKVAVTTAEPGQLIGPIEVPQGWWILVVEKKTPGQTTPLDSVKRDLARELAAQERAAGELDKIAQSVADAAVATPTTALGDVVKTWNQAHGGKTEGPLAAAETPPIGKSPVQAMSGGIEAMLGMPTPNQDPDEIPGLGKQPELVAQAWKLTPEQPVSKQVFKSEDGTSRYVVRLAKEPDDQATKDAIAKSRDMLGRAVVQMRKIEVWHGYVRKLLQQAQAEGKIKRTDVFTEQVAQEKQRYDEQVKRNPVAPGGLGGAGGIKLNVGGKEMPVQPAGQKGDEPKGEK